MLNQLIKWPMWNMCTLYMHIVLICRLHVSLHVHVHCIGYVYMHMYVHVEHLNVYMKQVMIGRFTYR